MTAQPDLSLVAEMLRTPERFLDGSREEQANLCEQADNATGEAVTVNRAVEGGLQSDDLAFAATLDKQAELAKIKKDDYGHYFLSEAAKRIRRLATPEQPGFRMTSDEGGWTKEDALRYIENWCPDYVKDYIVSLEQPGSAVRGGVRGYVRWHPKSGFDWRGVTQTPVGDIGTGWVDVPIYTTPPPAPAAGQGEK